MNLPQITIPIPENILPFDIPTMLHQPLVHFAIAIPVLVLLVEIVNLFLNNKTLKVATSLFMLLLVVILLGAYLTGTTDGKHAIDSGFNAVSELKEHKLDGIYLFYISIFVLFMKLLSLAINKIGFKLFYILILIAFNAGILHQGKEGGELVFKHGANVQMQKDKDEDQEFEKKLNDAGIIPIIDKDIEEKQETEAKEKTPAEPKKAEAKQEEAPATTSSTQTSNTEESSKATETNSSKE